MALAESTGPKKIFDPFMVVPTCSLHEQAGTGTGCPVWALAHIKVWVFPCIVQLEQGSVVSGGAGASDAMNRMSPRTKNKATPAFFVDHIRAPPCYAPEGGPATIFTIPRAQILFHMSIHQGAADSVERKKSHHSGNPGPRLMTSGCCSGQARNVNPFREQIQMAWMIH